MSKRQSKDGHMIPQQGRNVWVEVAKGEDGMWHWLMWSGNGRQIARNAVPFESVKIAVQSVKKMLGAAAAVKYVVQVHDAG